MIASRESVQAALRRAMALHPDQSAAVEAVAQALGLPREAVEEAAQEHPSEAAS